MLDDTAVLKELMEDVTVTVDVDTPGVLDGTPDDAVSEAELDDMPGVTVTVTVTVTV